MGSLYRAFTRNQNLQPLAEGIRSAFEEDQQYANLNKLYNLQKNLPNQLNQAIQPKSVSTDNMGINFNTPTPQLASGNRPNVIDLRNTPSLASQNTQGSGSNNNATGSMGNLQVSLASNRGGNTSVNTAANTKTAYPAIIAKVLGGNQPNIYQSVPGATAPTEQAFTQTVPLSNREQKQSLYDAATQYLSEIYGLQGLTPEQKQGAANILNMQLTSRMPEENEEFTLGEGQQRWSRNNNTGEISLITSNPRPQTPPQQKYIAPIIGRDGYYYYYNPKTGRHDDKSDVQAPLKDWQFAPREPKESKKPEALDLNTLVGNITANIVTERNLIKNTPSDKDDPNFAKIQKARAEVEANIQGNTDALIESASAAYPGLQRFVSMAWTKPKSQRASYINNLPIPAEAKKYMYIYFNSRER